MNVGSLVSPAFVFNARRDRRVRPVPEEEILACSLTRMQPVQPPLRRTALRGPS